MDVYLILRILTYNDSSLDGESPFLVFVKSDSNFPSIKVEHPCNFEALLRHELNKHISNIEPVINAKSFSTINTTEDRIEIYFNLFTNSTRCKDTGNFVKFNKKSMDLYRFANTQGKK